MKNLREKFKEIDPKNRQNIVAILITLVFVVFVLINKNPLAVVFTFNTIMLGLFYLIIIFIIGFSVMKALVHISAGLSLMIFLAQSYCAVPSHSIGGDNALKLLLLMSLFYLVFDFSKIFYKGLSEYFETFKQIKKDTFWKILLVLMCLTVVASFLWSIYQVVSPIILNLCIYK